MIDSAEQLRAELQALRETRLDLGLRAEGVIAIGRRRRGRRVAGWAVVALAVVIAVAVVLVQLSNGGRRLGGGIDPAQTMGVPEATASTTLELPTESDTPAGQLQVTVARAGDELRLVAHGRRSDREGTYSVAADRRLGQPIQEAMVDLGNGDGLRLGVLPGRASWLWAVDVPNSFYSVYTEHVVLTELDVTVYVLLFGSRDSSTITDLIWQATDGSIRYCSGETLPSAAFDFEGHSGVFYLDERARVVGLHSATDGDGGTTLDEGPLFLLQTEGRQESDRWRWFNHGLLPPGARDPELEPAHPSMRWMALQLGDRTLILVAAETVEQTDLVKSITFTDARGERVTQELS